MSRGWFDYLVRLLPYEHEIISTKVWESDASPYITGLAFISSKEDVLKIRGLRVLYFFALLHTV
jgi:hypothetical protein